MGLKNSHTLRTIEFPFRRLYGWPHNLRVTYKFRPPERIEVMQIEGIVREENQIGPSKVTAVVVHKCDKPATDILRFLCLAYERANIVSGLLCTHSKVKSVPLGIDHKHTHSSRLQPKSNVQTTP